LSIHLSERVFRADIAIEHLSSKTKYSRKPGTSHAIHSSPSSSEWDLGVQAETVVCDIFVYWCCVSFSGLEIDGLLSAWAQVKDMVRSYIWLALARSITARLVGLSQIQRVEGWSICILRTTDHSSSWSKFWSHV